VLFRESEHVDLGLWLRHLVRDRGPTPTFGQALACGLILLTIRFFATLAAQTPTTWNEFALLQFVTLAVLVALPALILTGVLTRSARATLLLRPASSKAVLLAVLLAFTLHPLALWCNEGVQRLYPIQEQILGQLQTMQQIIASAPSAWHILALLALTPAICEELAFRGFILSGLRHMGSRWGALVISSLLFGLTHGILQQSISAAMVGIVLGYMAVQTGSLLPCIAFHLMYNTLGLATLLATCSTGGSAAWWTWLAKIGGETADYRGLMIMAGTLLSLAILAWFHRLPQVATPEEELPAATTRPAPHATTL
jgi:sodium transport system permease protein